MDITQIEELAAAYALGALNPEEQAEVEKRLVRGDKVLAEAIETFGGTASLMMFSSEPRTPRSGFKERLMSNFTTEPGKEQKEKPLPFFFLKATEGTWEEIHEGVSQKILYRDDARKTTTLLMRMGPGTAVPSHSHDGPEELYILEGSCFCQGKHLGPGDYHRAEPHSDHNPTTSENGCMMMVISVAA